jgi:hypothetical protein
MLQLLSKIKSNSNGLLEPESASKGAELSNLLNDYSSSLRDIIDNLENDMIGVEGIDVFDIKTSPSNIIDNLRSLKEHTRRMDQKVENFVKLIIKAKGNGEFADEIENASYGVQKIIGSTEKLGKSVSDNLKNVLDEMNDIKGHSKELLKKKIL